MNRYAHTYTFTVEVKSNFTREFTQSLLNDVCQVGVADAEETMKHDPNPHAEKVTEIEIGEPV